MRLSKTEQLFRTLPDDVQYDIEMQLYYEFNDIQTKVEELIWQRVAPKEERTYWKREETRRKRELTERWLKENGTDRQE